MILPFEISKEKYPSYQSGKKIWDLDNVRSLATGEDSYSNHIIYANWKNIDTEAGEASFESESERDQAYTDMRARVFEPRDVKYYPA